MKRAILATPTKYGVAGIATVAPGAATITAALRAAANATGRR